MYQSSNFYDGTTLSINVDYTMTATVIKAPTSEIPFWRVALELCVEPELPGSNEASFTRTARITVKISEGLSTVDDVRLKGIDADGDEMSFDSAVEYADDDLYHWFTELCIEDETEKALVEAIEAHFNHLKQKGDMMAVCPRSEEPSFRNCTAFISASELPVSVPSGQQVRLLLDREGLLRDVKLLAQMAQNHSEGENHMREAALLIIRKAFPGAVAPLAVENLLAVWPSPTACAFELERMFDEPQKTA